MMIINIICEMQDKGLCGRALSRLDQDGFRPDVRQYVTSDIDANESVFFEITEALKECSLVIIRVHAGLTYFKKYDRLKEIISKEGVSLIIQSEMPDDIIENRPLFRGSEEDYLKIRSYIELGGEKNESNLYLWLMREIDGLNLYVDPPER